MGGYYPTNYALKSMKVFSAKIFEGVAYGTIRNREFLIPIGYKEELEINLDYSRLSRKTG